MKTSLSIFIILCGISLNSMAAIVCHTPRMNRNFEIDDNKISFFQEGSELKHREIASLVTRNKVDGIGLTKVVNFENQKHIIHIENVDHFSDINDYIIIKNNTGHEIVYPLSCNNN